MVGRNVQQHRHDRPEELNRLQLKGTDFEGQKIQVSGLIGHGAHREADVTRRDGFTVSVFEDAVNQFRGCGLAVSAGDGNVQAEGLLVAQFEFTNHRNVALDESLDQGRPARHTGTDDGQISGVTRRLFDAEPDVHAGSPQRLSLKAQLRRVGAVNRQHSRSTLAQQIACRATAQPEPDDQHPFVCQPLHVYRNFNVLKATTAHRMHKM